MQASLNLCIYIYILKEDAWPLFQGHNIDLTKEELAAVTH